MEYIIDKYGFKEGLTTTEGKITNWPYTEKKPTIAQLKLLESNYKNKILYKENRVKEYPSIEDQLDMIYKDKVSGSNKWIDLITSIKVKNPKPV